MLSRTRASSKTSRERMAERADTRAANRTCAAERGYGGNGREPPHGRHGTARDLRRYRIPMTQSADSRKRNDPTCTRWFYGSPAGRVASERHMRSIFVVVGDVGTNQACQMPWPERDHMIEQLPPERAYEPFCEAVLPRRARSGLHLSNAEVVDPSIELPYRMGAPENERGVERAAQRRGIERTRLREQRDVREVLHARVWATTRKRVRVALFAGSTSERLWIDSAVSRPKMPLPPDQRNVGTSSSRSPGGKWTKRKIPRAQRSTLPSLK